MGTEIPASPSDSLRSSQTVIALAGIAIVAGTVIGVFIKGDAPTLQLVVGLVIGTFGGNIFSFYFGSSKGSQQKDETIAAQSVVPLGAVVSTTMTPATTTTITEPQESKP